MISTIYTITNKAGESISFNDHTTDPQNFIALQDYPQFDLDIKNNEIDREGQHGVWDFFSYYGRRTVGFQGVIIGENETEVETLKADLIRILSFPVQPNTTNDGQVYLRWTDFDGIAWEIECKLANNIRFSRSLRHRYRLDFNLTLKSAYPFILSQTSQTQVGTRGWTTTGGVFPLELPAILGSTDNNILQVNNTGMIAAQTIIRIYGEVDGAVTNPKIRNNTTGKTFYLSSTIPDENSWIEIDSKEGTVVDQDGVDLSGEIIGESEFITLATGVNDIVYLSDEDPLITLYLPTAPFSVNFRKTKI